MVVTLYTLSGSFEKGEILRTGGKIMFTKQADYKAV